MVSAARSAGLLLGILAVCGQANAAVITVFDQDITFSDDRVLVYGYEATATGLAAVPPFDPALGTLDGVEATSQLLQPSTVAFEVSNAHEFPETKSYSVGISPGPRGVYKLPSAPNCRR